jgi:uncharacterized protein YjbJ (UPF0337 family)
MDPNRVEGKGRELKGDAKRVAGDVTGNKSMKAEGIVDKVAGKAQRAFGRLKDELRSESKRKGDRM